MQTYAFPRERRIRHRGVFKEIQRVGQRVVTRHLVFLVHPNQEGASRLGLIVSRKVGKAVVRNRIKRVLREAFRLKRPFDAQPVDIVVIPRRTLPKEAPFALVSGDFDEFIRRAEPVVQRFEGTP